MFKLLSVTMVAAAVWIAADIIRQSLRADDGGPPMGALCLAVPAAVLLIGAAVVWPRVPRDR
jgi:hypothetical protein